jgi:prolyl oligopeptidase
MKHFLRLLALGLFFFTQAHSAPVDQWLWLEDVDSPRALEWVRAQNKQTLESVAKGLEYGARERRLLRLLEASDRLILPSVNRHGKLTHHWQNAKHPRGIIRTTTYESYLSQSPQWKVLLDIDALAQAESENWIYAGEDRVEWPFNNRTMIALSRGGADARVLREYDVASKRFVENGFAMPEAENFATWLDANRLLISTSLNGKTRSGYARQFQVWRRGENLENAQTVFEVREDDLAADLFVERNQAGLQNIVFIRTIDFFRNESFLVGDSWSLTKIPVPDSAEIEGIQGDRLFILIREDWPTQSAVLKAGSLVELNLKDFSEKPKVVFEPDSHTSVGEVHITETQIYLKLQKNGAGELWRYSRESNGELVKNKISLPELGSIYLMPAEEGSDDVFVTYSNFLQPTTLYRLNADSHDPMPLKQAPSRFDPSSLLVEQKWATSKDGTQIPYFLVRPKNSEGPMPTVLYGYGGFEISLNPYYLGNSWIGSEWLHSGRAYVIANIRGGGEFGPDWHRAALKENRQRAYDDFIAVAEDLAASKITTPEQLGIMGESNGGLLVGATFTQRPDLCAAVVCGVPLLDMLRYHLLLKGHSWIAEYGNPEDPRMQKILRRYSPYHNIPSALSPMPKVLFVTSTRDDRVHPAHARKMTAQMQAMGHSPLLFENIEGGHNGAANSQQEAQIAAMTCSFFMKSLGLRSPPERSKLIAE